MKALLLSFTVLLTLALLFLPVTAAHAQEGQPVQVATAGGSMENSFVDAAVNGIPLTLLVFGLVAFLKMQGVQGKQLLFASLGSGLLLGIGYMVYKTRPPIGDWWVVYGYWFGVIIYGLGLGLLASGVYEGARSAVTSVLTKFPMRT